MSEEFDRSRCLDDLEGVSSGEPEFDTVLVTRCYALRKKPVGEFGVEDLRIMIGQEIGLPFLIPLALEILEVEPLAEGDYYPGDLLSNVLRVGETFWVRRPDCHARVGQILRRLQTVPSEVSEAARSFTHGAF
ncbi:MAG: contact-dependent growth inhibition system immunity protein [Candidatus Polarisedimenticolia bacterium]